MASRIPTAVWDKIRKPLWDKDGGVPESGRKPGQAGTMSRTPYNSYTVIRRAYGSISLAYSDNYVACCSHCDIMVVLL